jgi:hypothetical protein
MKMMDKHSGLPLRKKKMGLLKLTTILYFTGTDLIDWLLKRYFFLHIPHNIPCTRLTMVRRRVELRDREEAGAVAKKLLVNGYITQITEREKIDDEEAMFRYEKVLASASKKVRRISSQHTCSFVLSLFRFRSFLFCFSLFSIVRVANLSFSLFVRPRARSFRQPITKNSKNK